MQVSGPIGRGPLPGPSSSNSGLAGDVFVGLVHGAIFLFIGIVVLALVTYGLAYVSVHVIGVTTGLLDAWAGLVVLTVSDGLSEPLVLENLLFGAIVGVLLALAQFRHRWRKHHHGWIVEALVSPETLTAVRFGFVCVALNVVISMLAAWMVSQLGVQFPWPTGLGGHGAAVLITGAIPGGGGAGGGWDPESFLMSLVFLLCFVSIAVAIVVALSWSGLGWLLVQSAPSATALHAMGTAAARGAVYGGSLATAGALMQLALTERLARDPHNIRSEAWFFPAFFNGIAIGAANGALIVTIVIAGAALFGLTAAAQ